MNLKKILSILRFLPHSIYFNIKYLPFKQAMRLPILLYKPKFLKTSGKILIKSNEIRLGMIQLGFPMVALYPNSGIKWENSGGICIFEGKCHMGNNTVISIGERGLLHIYSKFNSPSSLKIACFHSITFKDNVTFGWECIVSDTDFHVLKSLNKTSNKNFAPIIIGKNNWIALRCTILKGSETPDFCIVGANSLLNKKYNYPAYSLIAGNPAVLKKEGIYIDIDQSFEYPPIDINKIF